MIPFVINTPSPPTDIANFHLHACLPIDPDRKCLNHFLILLMISDTLNPNHSFSRIPIADYAGSNLISTKINKWKSSLEVWLVGEKSNRLLQKSIFSSKFFMIHCPWTQAQDRDYLKFSVRFLDLWVLGTFHFFPFLFHRFYNVKIALGPCRYCR